MVYVVTVCDIRLLKFEKSHSLREQYVGMVCIQ